MHIRTERHERVFHFRDDPHQPNRDIVIGDYVWIGSNCYISGGVTIGGNSILGANSVVTHDIPANMIYGGSPARLIRDKRTYLP